MRNEQIRKTVRTLFDRIGEAAVRATLRQKTQSAYEPGSVGVETLSETAIRLVRTEKSLRDSKNVAGSVITAPYHYALIECESVVPKADDDLLIGSDVFTLLQVIVADTGAGILYEVCYQ
ncbi:MAG: hypothetical protein EP348_00170 [Alphaproteobacteria bacterium]|nr:MAG: hypothetical protein EP348_00170 [Alphaproteobacteria bacterium]